jgi:hypothetical protein
MRIISVSRPRKPCVLAALAALAACSQDSTGPRSASDRPVLALPEIEAVGCRYGGEYPNCSPPPPSPFDEPREPLPGDDETGGGGGGTPPPPSDSTTTCDPKTDPRCEQPLTSTDSTTLLKAIRDHVRPDTAIADTANRRKCKQMLDRFLQSFNGNTVFRGGSDLTTGSHYGATYRSRIHFDPWLLGRAAGGSVSDLRELANTALHEAAHVLGLDHPNGEANGIYTDSPFNLLPPGQGACIK